MKEISAYKLFNQCLIVDILSLPFLAKITFIQAIIIFIISPYEISLATRGALAKGKKKVKPGYKRAIKWQIEEENKKNRRAERNKNARKTRDSRKQSF